MTEKTVDIPPVCIYHKDCVDGFAAAWVVRSRFPNAIFHSASYGDDVPVIPPGAVVYIVDFSYPMEKLTTLCERAGAVHVLDHHASAIKRLTESDIPTPDNLHLVLDINRSGAGITWDTLRNGHRPNFIKYAEDYDLWRFQYGDLTRNYQRYLAFIGWDFEAWDTCIRARESDVMLHGELLRANDRRQMEWHINNTWRGMMFEGTQVSLINVPRYATSLVNNEVLNFQPVVLSYYDTPATRVYRINTRPDSGIDASELAERYGGGGHKNAAGFTVTRDHPLAQC